MNVKVKLPQVKLPTKLSIKREKGRLTRTYNVLGVSAEDQQVIDMVNSKPERSSVDNWKAVSTAPALYGDTEVSGDPIPMVTDSPVSTSIMNPDIESIQKTMDSDPAEILG